MVHRSAKYNSEDNLLEDEKTFSSRVNETEKPFKDSLGYPSNPLNPSNPPSPSNPSSLSHPPNPRFKDSPTENYVEAGYGMFCLFLCFSRKQNTKIIYRKLQHNYDIKK